MQTAGPSANATILIMFGQHARTVERWDGSLEVTGGELVELEGREFLAADSIAPPSWKCATRADAVEPYADIHYTEVRPGSKPPVLYHPVGVYASMRAAGGARVSVRTVQGVFAFPLGDIGGEPREFLDGRVTVARVPVAEKLSDAAYQHDEPAIAALPDGGLAAAWVAYRNRADRVLLRVFDGRAWSPPEEVTPEPGDIFRCAAAADSAGGLWVFWSRRDGSAWKIWGRRRLRGSWEKAQVLADQPSNTFVRAASAPDGSVFLTWQRLRPHRSDIYFRAWRGGAWSPEILVSEPAAGNWEPAIAAAPDGAAYIAWDTYDRGNYDIAFRIWRSGSLSELRRVTTGPRFQAHASVAADPQNRPWMAWDESGVNWGKDQGFLIPTPLATPMHKQRSVRVAVWDGRAWLAPPAPPSMGGNAEHPQLVFDGGGMLRARLPPLDSPATIAPSGAASTGRTSSRDWRPGGGPLRCRWSIAAGRSRKSRRWSEPATAPIHGPPG